jgi:hypothetical protein
LRKLVVPEGDSAAGWTSSRAGADVCVRLRLPADIAPLFRGAIESGRQRATAAAIPARPPARGDMPASVRAARPFVECGRRVPAWVGLLVLLEDYIETWDDPTGFPKRRNDAIYERDGHRCMAPGCTARCCIEDHHIVYRSRNGGNEPWNQLCLCRFHHHQGEHGFLARCRGQAPLDVVWRLGERAIGRWYRNERRLSRQGENRWRRSKAR